MFNLKKKILSCPSIRLPPEKCKHCHAIKTLLRLFNHPSQPSTATLAPRMVRVWDGSTVSVLWPMAELKKILSWFLASLFWLNYTPLMTCQFKCGKPCGEGPVVCVCQHNMSVSIVSGASHTSFHSHSLWQKKKKRKRLK